MKNIYKQVFMAICTVTALVSMQACSDSYFLDPLEQTLTKDSLYVNSLRAQSVLNQAYYNIPYKWPWKWGNSGYNNQSCINQDILASLTDEGVATCSWTGAPKLYYINALTPDVVGINGKGNKTSVEHVFEAPYNYGRHAWLFLENYKKIPDATPEWKKNKAAEARMLIAIGYFELLKRYGGVPYLDGSHDGDLSSSIETRMPFAELVNTVDDLIAQAIPDLPIRYTDTDLGRISRAAAYMLRSRLWLYAASPLFNTDEPYMNMDDPKDNNLICMMTSTDQEKKAIWEKCAQYTKEAIDFCESNGYKLVDTGNPKIDYTTATRDLTGNTEVISFSRRLSGFAATNPNKNNLYARFLPPDANNKNNARGNLSVTENMVEMYRTADGEDFKLNENVKNPWTVKAMDPRFYASIVYDKDNFGGAEIGLNAGDPFMAYWVTGYTLRKFLHEEQYTSLSQSIDAPYFYMRLPELYLNYAEALNEMNGNNSDIETYLNKTIHRVDMPTVSTAGKSQEEIRIEIRRERAVEFAFEDQRYFDCKRWLIADQIIGVDKNPRKGVKRQSDGTYRVADVVTNNVNGTYVWQDKFYLMPLPRTEIQLHLGMKQNPGYN